MARDDTDMDDTAGRAGSPVGAVPWTLHAVPRPPIASAPLIAPHATVATGAMEPEEVARITLEALRQRHRDLDLAIQALQAQGTDPLSVRRLKKRKLALRDRIAAIEDRLTPDIIA